MRFFCVVCAALAGDCASGVKESLSRPKKNGELKLAPERCLRRCIALVGGDCISAKRQGDPAAITFDSIWGSGELSHGKSGSLPFFMGVPAGVSEVPTAACCMSNKQDSTPPAAMADRFGDLVSSMKTSLTP